MKKKEKEMKDEKQAERQVCDSFTMGFRFFEAVSNPWTRQKWIQGIKDKREAKAEKERYAKLAEKMHIKRVERLKRREKRNKMLKS
jgi:rRNA-processing protein CGR1